MKTDAMDVQESSDWLDHLTYHLVRYKFATRMTNPMDHVMDYGCGTGYGSRMIADVANSVLGVDSDEGMIEKATAQYQKDNLKYLTWNLLESPEIPRHLVPPQGFHLITCMELIEHLSPSSTKKLLRRLRDHLCDGGVFILSTPRYKPPNERSEYRQQHHIYEYTYNNLKELLDSTFSRSFIFTQTDEIITMGNPNVCWTYVGVCLNW